MATPAKRLARCYTGVVQIHSVEGNTQRLDGGSMFGNCPRVVWERWSPPDEQHRITLACRSLLVVEDDGRKVLLETGIGAFFPPKLRERYGVQEERHVLLDSLAALGIAPEAIDVIVLSHLHFDHAGGLLAVHDPANPEIRLAFPNARYVVGREAFERAQTPHSRDRASFIAGLCELLEATGRLELVHGETSTTLGPRYRMVYSHGHTPGLMLTRVETPIGAVTFLGDLVPGTPWVHLPITMGYDRFPELLIDEKKALLQAIVAENGWAFYTHDPATAVSRIAVEADGRFRSIEPRPVLDV
jgi:glyoxylase-like metal-dependent hydrolase (beta-lactamase superfamily II)